MAVDPLAKKMNARVRDVEHYKRVALSIQTFNEKRTFTDLCFVCARGHKVYAHKLLICTVSTLLKKMFLEIQDNLQTIFVHLPDIESRTMELLMSFLYEGAVQVSQSEYTNIQSIMNTLGIDLTSPSANSGSGNTRQQMAQTIPQPQQQIILQQQQQLPVPQQQLQTSQQQLQTSQQQLQSPQQASQLLYMPTAPNAQGQVQYVLATPNQLNQAQVLQSPLMTPVVTQQTSGQIVQNGTQVLNSQQGNMMQMVQQNNTQMVPMNQLVSGGQMVQCSSQMGMQGNQNLVSNNQLQFGMQAQSNYTNNQPVQQQMQYVMASNTNQLSNNRTTTQLRRGQGGGRARPAVSSAPQIQQHPRINNEAVGEHTGLVETIKSILQDSIVSTEKLTARKIRESLEQKFDNNLAHVEEEIDAMLKTCEMPENKYVVPECKPENKYVVPECGPSVKNVKKPKGPNRRTRKRKKLSEYNSDDEADEDFDPKKKY